MQRSTALRARRLLRRALILGSVVIASATPLAALADCCTCTASSNPTQKVCLTIQTGGCATIQQQAANTNITSMTCQTQGLTPTQCNTTKPQGQCDVIADASTYNPNSSSNIATGASISVVPELGVKIPGVEFGMPVRDAKGQIAVPFLAQYVAGVYNYMLGISLVAAAIMIVYGGFKYILGSTALAISSGRDTIIDAIIGLFLVFGSYTLLAVLNPATVAPTAIQITAVSPDESWIQDHGTGDPFYSAQALTDAQNMSVNGAPTPSGTYAPPTAQQIALAAAQQKAATPGQPVPPPLPTELVDVSKIPFDASLGGPANINNFCSTRAEGGTATTYDDKIKLLVKAVMGFYKTCVQNHLCAYCQGCGTTIPAGMITAGANPSYIVQNAIQRGMTTPEGLWSGKQQCIDAYNSNKYAVNAMPECSSLAKDFYQTNFIENFTKAKMYATDCGGFAFAVYGCANAKKLPTPTERAYDNNTKKFVNTGYLSAKSLETYMQQPGAVAAGHMNDDINALAAAKGGIRFGDLVYTCCGGSKDAYSAHWFMYTGGRPDVPFSYIEMGGLGANVSVPGIPQGVSTVQAGPAGGTLQDYLARKITPTQLKTSSGKVYGTLPASQDGSKGLVFVFRPYADSPGAPGFANP